jgi:hypothetical protein
MRTTAALLLSVLLTFPASAETCWFEAPSGDRLTFLDNGENEVVRQYANGQTETCVSGHADDGSTKIWCDFETMTQSVVTKIAAGIAAFEAEWRPSCDKADNGL